MGIVNRKTTDRPLPNQETFSDFIGELREQGWRQWDEPQVVDQRKQKLLGRQLIDFIMKKTRQQRGMM